MSDIIREELINLLANYCGIDKNKITSSITLKSLGIDSLAGIELVILIEDIFNIKLNNYYLKLDMTFEDLYLLISEEVKKNGSIT